LQNEAEVKPVRFAYDGRKVKGTEIRITPYQDDPHRAQIEPYADKFYVFTLSEAVPGEVYQLRTVVPAKRADTDGDSTPMLEEVLTLSAVDRLASPQAVH
jgi:hypothetical protein